jgi:uncharacterized membrane protein YhhN
MNIIILVITIVIAVIDWIAVAKNWKRLEYFAKPGVMLALLAYLATANALQGQLVWFTLGVFFSMFGDIFLMLPKEQFIPGLISFLLAHLAYTVGFTTSLPNLDLPTIILIFILLLTAYQVFKRISEGLDSKQLTRLKIPVLAYTIIITLMVFSAITTFLRLEWSFLSAMSVSIGAILFFLSDTILAWNKFVQPLRFGKLITIINYHAGQILIVIGAVYHFTNY